MQKHLEHFESLRGIAALWVALSHVLLICEYEVPVLSQGGWAVDLFVILSGFVIGLLRVSNSEPYLPYLIRRFGRIYPLYVFALLLGLLTSKYYAAVIGVSFWGNSVSPEFLIRTQNENDGYLAHLILHITMLHGAVSDSILPQAALTFSGPLWSISLEWQFYLLAPFLILALDVERKNRWPWALAVLLVSVFAYWLSKRLWVGEVPSFLPFRLPFFIFGILSAIFWNRFRSSNRWVVVVYLVLGFLVLPKFGANRLSLLLWGGTYFCALFGGYGMGWIDRVLTSQPLKWLGQRSYGLYLLHMPLLLIFCTLISGWLPELGQFATMCILIAFVGCVVVPLAAIVYKYFEMPMNKYFRQLAANVSANAAASPSN
ncbi:acyltransferase family protein [Roseateles sp. NT4]|uniref:acyltransferase family protein n=1 Tax=Roseateles sp. NT4 TaxID=3453715 RepID=UPI003EEF4ECB